MITKGKSEISGDIRRILLVQLGDIGDVVLSFPCILALRERFPRADIFVAVREKAAELIEDCPWATEVIAIRAGKGTRYQKDFFCWLRKQHFDLAVDLRTGTRGAILAFLSRAGQRVGFNHQGGPFWRKWIFTHLAAPYERPDKHMAETYANLMGEYQILPSRAWPEIHVPDYKQEMAKGLFDSENIPPVPPTIAVQPFSLWRYKEWSTEKYSRLIRRISIEFNLPVIIVGSPDEIERAERIKNNCGSGVYNIAGKTSLGVLAAVLKTCRLFIGGDSGGMHIAAGVGTPTITIFGPSSSSDWAPRGRNHQVVKKDYPCLPCHQKGCDGNGASRCLKELTVDEVFFAVSTQMERK